MAKETPRETGYFRTEGGAVLEMDLPLPEPIAERVAKQEIVRVANLDGDPWEAPPAEPVVDHKADADALRTQLAEAEAANADLTGKLAEAEEKLAALAAKKPAKPAAKPAE